MTDTTPTPADRPADQLRAAAEKLRSMDPLTADRLTGIANPVAWWLEWQAAVLAEGQTAALDPALAVARQLLGTTVAEPESGCAHCGSPDHAWDDCAAYTALVRDDAAVPPAPADRAAVLREAGERLQALANRTTERGSGVLWAADWLLRLADDAAAGVQPPTTARDLTARWDEATGKPTPLCPCGYVPVACDADRGCTPPAAPAAPEATP
ncbi:hypothetical protein IX27_18070 [Streptomyces sp. JS01]|uniref:hypothetical protein n=1 Tax=Streptomyces sp. JS01 TaxID=1525753 RepID=UPI000502EB41|nr:hypothetical protein [Streptomyces sp. JS01]KFK87803.1 hypothetical protein IX27_18070 [Streptomyces sp. JS01]